MGASSKIGNPVRKHKRDVWLKIVFPVDALVSKQISIVMSILATCFLALPAVFLCAVPYALLAVIAALAGRGYAQARTPLRFARRTTEKIAIKTDQYAPRVAQPLLALNVRLTRWEKTLRCWLQLESQKDESHG
jgi:hypothetical protein